MSTALVLLHDYDDPYDGGSIHEANFWRESREFWAQYTKDQGKGQGSLQSAERSYTYYTLRALGASDLASAYIRRFLG
jgi:hypothetical protein